MIDKEPTEPKTKTASPLAIKNPFINELMELIASFGKKSQIFSILGFITAGITFTVGYLSLERNETSDVFFVALLSIIFAMLFEMLSNYFTRDEIDRTIGVQIKAIESHTLELKELITSQREGLVFLGRGSQAASLVVQHLNDAHRVKNTLITFKGGMSEYNISASSIVSAYSNVLRKPGSQWEDILTISSQYGKRRVEAVSKMFSENGFPGLYRCYDISDRPNVNFILIGTRDIRFDVLFFGWGYQENNNDGVVMMSRDPILIDMFNAHFEMLKVTSAPYNHKKHSQKDDQNPDHEKQ